MLRFRLIPTRDCPIRCPVKGKEFIDRVMRIGRERGVSVRIDTERGKGSHITIYFGDRFTVVKGRRTEIGPGLLSAMIRQLGLARTDIRQG